MSAWVAIGGGPAICAAIAKGASYAPKSACLAAVPGTKECEAFDKMEQFLSTFDQKVDMPITHTFSPGMYHRSIFMPKGYYVTSRIHKTRHAFTVVKGKVKVQVGENSHVILEAPYAGITEAGTRRLLETLEDTIWETHHVTDETDPDKLVDILYAPHYDHIKHVRDFRDNTNSTQFFANEGRIVPPTFDKLLTTPDQKTLEEQKP